MEAEAEEHQKRREVQYQSLLAPSTQSSPMAATNSSVTDVDHSFPQFSLPEVQATQDSHIPTDTDPIASSFANTSRTLSEMENMGYDQVINNYCYNLYCIAIPAEN